MADFTIISRREKTYISPDTEEGRRWIRKNAIPSLPGDTVVINSEELEDFLVYLRSAELTYDERR